MSEPTNEDRAAWAENAVNTFSVETYFGRTFTATVVEQPDPGDDAYTMIQDLMSNLLHLARRQGWDAKAMNDAALLVFCEEVDEEAEII